MKRNWPTQVIILVFFTVWSAAFILNRDRVADAIADRLRPMPPMPPLCREALSPTMPTKSERAEAVCWLMLLAEERVDAKQSLAYAEDIRDGNIYADQEEADGGIYASFVKEYAYCWRNRNVTTFRRDY